MNTLLAYASLAVATAALMGSVLEYRAPDRYPLWDFARARFPRTAATTRQVWFGLALGTGVVVMPLAVFLLSAQVRLEPRTGSWGVGALLLGLATVALKLFWAAIEELMMRGALLTQLVRLMPTGLALVASAILFSAGHLSRSADRAPDLVTLLVIAIDGVGFGLAFLATRSLWLPAAWHAGKNLSVWLLLGEGTIQLAPGPLQAHFAGPSLWVGSQRQSGIADVIASSAAIVVLLVVCRRRFAGARAWLVGPRPNAVGAGENRA